MAVAIRLKRMGANKKLCYRIVVADSRSPRDGISIEEIGSYDPKREPPFITLKKERAKYWMSVGAQPSPTVKSIFKKQGLK